MRKIKCDYCGAELERFPSQIYKTNFCNKECHDNYQRRNGKIVYCATCGKEIGYKSPVFLKQYKKFFCSKQCEGQYASDKRFTPSNYEHIDNYLKIEMNTVKYGKQYCLIDDEFEYLMKENRFYCRYYDDSKTFMCYFLPKMSDKRTFVHRYVTNCPNNMQVDHINHNGLDNRKCNLRVCTQYENQQNRRLNSKSKSGYKNVIWHSKYNKWAVMFQIDHKVKYYGRYSELQDAINVADKVRKELHPFSTETYVY